MWGPSACGLWAGLPESFGIQKLQVSRMVSASLLHHEAERLHRLEGAAAAAATTTLAPASS